MQRISLRRILHYGSGFILRISRFKKAPLCQIYRVHTYTTNTYMYSIPENNTWNIGTLTHTAIKPRTDSLAKRVSVNKYRSRRRRTPCTRTFLRNLVSLPLSVKNSSQRRRTYSYLTIPHYNIVDYDWSMVRWNAIFDFKGIVVKKN